MSSSTAPQTSHDPTSTPQSSTAHPPSNPTTPPQRTLHIGTRASALALAQTTFFTTLLASSFPHIPVSIHPTTTTGDHIQTLSLHALAQGGKALWTEELETLLLNGDIDCIVHSLKDVPTKLPEGCKVFAVGERAEAGDVVAMQAARPGGAKTLADLPRGAVVGTSSVRRAAMVRRSYPHLIIKDVRGNVGTRLHKLDDEAQGYDCLVLAGAGMVRLGLGERIASWVRPGEGMMRAVGQGAVGVEVREGDEWVEGLLAGRSEGRGVGQGKGASLRLRRVGWECLAERSLLRTVEGGCSVPVGVETAWEDLSPSESQVQPNPNQTPSQEPDKGPATLHLRAMVVSLDGTDCVTADRKQLIQNDTDAEECGWELARVLVERGAERILKGITLDRDRIQEQGGA